MLFDIGRDVAAVPIVEAVVALMLVDQFMAQCAQCELFPMNQEFQEPLELPKLESVSSPFESRNVASTFSLLPFRNYHSILAQSVNSFFIRSITASLILETRLL